MTVHTKRNAAILVILGLLLTACGDGAASSPTPSFVPAVTIFAPSPVPTDTPVPTPPPTATAEPATASPSAETATPQPADGAVNPFTGLRVSDPAVLDRIPLLIKVANTSEVRPQTGLSQADVVVEHFAEGGITRFTALYLTNSPEKVGSVRSCRLIDIELPRIFDAALVCSGTSPGVKPTLRASWLFDKGEESSVKSSVVIISDFGPFECPTCPMFRTSDQAPPHNLFANAPNAWREMTDRGKNQRTAFHSWTFDAAAPAAGKTVTTVDVPYNADPVTWSYNAGSGVWERKLNGAPHTDALTGSTLTADNVIVAYAHHAVTGIQEDTTGARSIQIQLWGEGPLKVFRDGRMIDGKWLRSNDPGVLQFVDAQGKLIPLKPGNTWIELAPLDFPVQAR